MDPMDMIYDIVRGPLALFACTVFGVGTLFQVSRFYFLSRRIEQTRFSPGAGNKRFYTASRPPRTRENRMASITVSIFGVHPVTAIVSTLFHACLLLAPLLAMGHNKLIYESWGIRILSLPERFTDIMAQGVIAGAVFFLCRRLLLRRVRAISTPIDFVILLLTAAPFVTGVLAFHQVFAYQPMIVLHMVTGALLLILIPFTRLAHMIFFFINRLAINQQNSFTRGRRTWYFGSPGFSLKEWYFGKEKFEIEKW